MKAWESPDGKPWQTMDGTPLVKRFGREPYESFVRLQPELWDYLQEIDRKLDTLLEAVTDGL